MAIVTIPERGHGGAHLFDVLEDTAVNSLLLQRPVETPGDTIGLRLGNEGEASASYPST
jgi:hypothetical protein